MLIQTVGRVERVVQYLVRGRGGRGRGGGRGGGSGRDERQRGVGDAGPAQRQRRATLAARLALDWRAGDKTQMLLFILTTISKVTE